MAFLALMSIALAAVISLIANHTMSIHGLSLGETISYGGMDFSTYYTELNWRSFWLPALAVFGSALLVSIFPGMKAARTRPARTMRMH
jgi:ABC-type lipoprotein release transport system permease subunit